MYHARYKRWAQPHHPCTTRDGHNPIIYVPCTIQEMDTTSSSMYHKRWAQPHHLCTMHDTRDGHNLIIHVPQEMGQPHHLCTMHDTRDGHNPIIYVPQEMGTTPSSMYHARYKRWAQPHHLCTMHDTRDGHNPIIHVPCTIQEMGTAGIRCNFSHQNVQHQGEQEGAKRVTLLDTTL